MISLFRPVFRSTAFRSTSLRVGRPVVASFRVQLQSRRGAANSVTNQPGSRTLEHAATNIKEEVGNSAADLAKIIAGANVTSDAVKPTDKTFVSFSSYQDDFIMLLFMSSLL